MKEVPQPWATRLEQKGFTHQGKAAYSPLARECNLAVETVRRAINGIGDAEVRTVEALSQVLGEDVQEWLGVKLEGPYYPPDDAQLLDPEERETVDQVIRLLARSKRRRVGRVTTLRPRTPAAPSRTAARKDTD